MLTSNKQDFQLKIGHWLLIIKIEVTTGNCPTNIPHIVRTAGVLVTKKLKYEVYSSNLALSENTESHLGKEPSPMIDKDIGLPSRFLVR